MIPLHHNKLFKHPTNKFILGKVTQVDDSTKTIHLQDGSTTTTTTVTYDILICATGSRNFSPAEPSPQITSVEETKAYWQETKSILKSVQHVAVMSSGPVALELVGEIKAYAPHLNKLSLIVGSHQLLHNVKPPLPNKYKQQMLHLLGDLHIDVINQDVKEKINIHQMESPIVKLPQGFIELANGEKLQADVLFCAIGLILQTSMYPKEWLDDTTKEVKIDEFWRVNGRNDVFAIGDIAKTNSTKLGLYATEDAAVVAKNIVDIVKKHKTIPTHKLSRSMEFMIIPVGPRHGRSIFPVIGIVGDYLTSMMKGKGLYENMTWKAVLGMSAPVVSKEEEKE
jgi:NADH dehydrogenase FAD-containing subunit